MPKVRLAMPDFSDFEATAEPCMVNKDIRKEMARDLEIPPGSVIPNGNVSSEVKLASRQRP